MQKQSLTTILLILIVAGALFTSGAFADYSVGVKKGDWIQYTVKITGTPTPEYNVTGGKMEMTGVLGDAINMSVQTFYANGTIWDEPYVFVNLSTGQVGDGFFIPANFNVGDKFYGEFQGNMTMASVEQRHEAGADRTVVSASANGTLYYWDRQTGILVAAVSNMPGYTMYTETSATNIWQPQVLGVDLTEFYAIIAAFAVVLAGLAAVLVWKKKKPKRL
jgi:hypothetical protein